MGANRKYKRKMLNFAIQRGMQFRMIGKLTAIILISLLICSSVYYYYANQEITASFQLFHIKAKNFLDFLFPIVGVSFVVSLLVGTIASLFFPKNVAGPLYRIEQDVRRMIEELDLSVRINIRSGDEGKTLVQQLNKLTALFRETIAGVQGELQDIQAVSSAQSDISQEKRQELFLAACDRIRVKVSQFKTLP